MKLSNFRIKDKLSQKLKLQQINSQKEEKQQENHPNLLHDERFSNFLNSFQNLINSLTQNQSKSQIQTKISPQQSEIKSYKNLDYRDRYVIVQLPEFTNEKIDLNKLQAWIGEVCQQTLSVAFHYFTQKKFNYEQMKVFASQSLLRNICVLVDTYKITASEIKFIDKTMEQSVFPYLKAKYPLTVQNDINKALQSVIEEIDNTQILANDYFFSSDIHFEYRQSGRYDDLIMRFLNEILTKIDMKVGESNQSELTLFKDFQNTMNNIFQKSFDQLWINSKDSLKESKTLLSQKQKEKYRNQVQQYTHFSVNRKISQNTLLYTQDQIKSGYLSVRSSTVLRILTKWCDQLWEKFQNQNYYRDRTDGLGLIYNKKVALVFPWLKTLLTKHMKDQKGKILDFFKEIQDINYAQQIQLLQNQLQDPENNYIKKYEKVVGKFACKIFKNIEHFIVVYLNRLIHGLTNVSKKCFAQMKTFPEYWPTPYNLLSFKIGDLLRCKYSSKQKEVLKIFKQIERIGKQNEDKLKIIRIKNRLKQGTNDILINAKIDNSITCQIQLAVNSAYSDFMVCSNYINHYIYQLQRSRFGPISQICSIWKNYDKRSKQFDRLISKQKPHRQQKVFQESTCVKQNKQHETINVKNPFICSQCNRHHHNSNFIFNHVKCKNCKYFKCAVCLIEENVKSENKDFFLKQNPFKEECKFWKNLDSVPKAGICIFVNRTQLQPVIFKKIQYNFKHNLIRKLNNQVVIMREVSSQKQLTKFLKECIIFQMNERNTYEQFGKENANSNTNYIVNLFIPQYIKNCLKQEKQTLSILREDHLTKVDFNKIVTQYRQKFKSIKNIQFSSTLLTDLDIILPEFINLKRLNINLNSVQDVSKLTTFKRLQKLYMNENKIQSLPDDIGKLQQLKQLYAYNNKIKSIPVSLLNMKSLTILNLSQNLIEEIPQNIFEIQNMNLTQLILSKNEITKIPQNIGKLSKLTLFQANINLIEEIPKSIENLVSLQILNLQSNKITQIPDQISCLQKLNKLNLKKNKLKSFNESVFKIQKIKWIQISENQIVDLPEKFDSLRQLTYLNIQKNKITKFPAGILKLSLQTFLYMGNLFQQYPFEVLKREKQEIHLQNEKIKNISFSNIPTYKNEITLVSLKNLDLQQFPEFVFNFPNIQKLQLPDNKLTILPDIFPLENRIKELNLSYNKISVLPSSIGNLKNLTRIQIEYNELSTIPDEFSQLIELNLLNIAKNKFTVIPPVLQQFQNLTCLYINSNEIEQLPQWIGKYKKLLILSAPLNKIKQIPLSICQNKTIQKLNLQKNQIKIIPKQINQMVSLLANSLLLSQNPIQQFGDKEFIVKFGDYYTKMLMSDKNNQDDSSEDY